MKHLCRGIPEVDQHLVHLAASARGHGKEAVEHRRFFPRIAKKKEPTARGARERPLGDEPRKSGGDDRIDSIASMCEGPRARLSGVTVARCDSSAHHERVVPVRASTPLRAVPSGEGMEATDVDGVRIRREQPPCRPGERLK